jgi:fructose/tagatose bisphosphate aldolase
VQHGGSGIHSEDVREAVLTGVVKINIGHAISLAMSDGARDAQRAGLDHYAMLKHMRERVRKTAAEKIQLMNADGRSG